MLGDLPHFIQEGNWSVQLPLSRAAKNSCQKRSLEKSKESSCLRLIPLVPTDPLLKPAIYFVCSRAGQSASLGRQCVAEGRVVRTVELAAIL